MRITQTQEAEVAVSQDHAIALQPGQQSENLSQKKKKFYHKKATHEWLRCDLEEEDAPKFY